MKNIVILSPSVRTGRNSHRVALYLMDYLKETNIARPTLVDLAGYNFPLFEERLRYQQDPSEGTIDFAAKIESADGVIMIVPEYNGSFPASLKNAVDLLYSEWQRKPVAFISVSAGSFAGSQAITAIQFVLWKIGALTVPRFLPVPNVQEAFNENGKPANKKEMDEKALVLIKELLTHTQ